MDKLIIDVKTFLAAHPLFVTLFLVPLALYLLASFVSWATWKESQAEWAEYCKAHPVRAFWIRVCRALGAHLMKILTQKYPTATATTPPTTPPTDTPTK